jgi:hypothetical protein
MQDGVDSAVNVGLMKCQIALNWAEAGKNCSAAREPTGITSDPVHRPLGPLAGEAAEKLAADESSDTRYE